MLFSAGFLQLAMKPTRCAANSATLIDHIITKSVNKKLESCILTSKISDHFPIFFTTSNLKRANHVKYLNVCDFSKKNVNDLKNDLSRLSWNNVYCLENVQESFNLFSQTFNDLYEMRFPERKIKFNKNVHKIEKWMTQGLLVSRLPKLNLAKSLLNTPPMKTYKPIKIIATFITHSFALVKKAFLSNSSIFINQILKRHGKLSIWPQKDLKKTKILPFV
jgi:hypothetical protein